MTSEQLSIPSEMHISMRSRDVRKVSFPGIPGAQQADDNSVEMRFTSSSKRLKNELVFLNLGITSGSQGLVMILEDDGEVNNNGPSAAHSGGRS
ncbi:hypothetical protein TNIN_243491 [Trichonephila inaurata madagascariensis]|uniref:Uncharacterized protein n=1 Tax=Trichonephila inaurata madagascariensis TaxID=2747483 RepID=A0A8X6YT33_9ARAC|nr:hypothetical protein TNIN_243491 [Trichonephila inaurata madagascariensis]